MDRANLAFNLTTEGDLNMLSSTKSSLVYCNNQIPRVTLHKGSLHRSRFSSRRLGVIFTLN